jgi:hypothetical protein
MASLGNLVVLKLNYIICLRPEDVDILGAIPTLVFLKLATAGGTNGRITVHGSNGFRSLKYLSLRTFCCGTMLEFQVGSMPKLEHVKLRIAVHKRECMNGASDLGIQHLSALSKVEVEIYGNCRNHSNYIQQNMRTMALSDGLQMQLMSYMKQTTMRIVNISNL